MLKTTRTLNYAVFLFGTVLGLAACAPSANDTVSLIKAGDGRACSSADVKVRLQEELTSFLSYRKLRSELNGKSLRDFGFVFDPIVSTSSAPGVIECAASAYLSLDGKQPFSSNEVEFEYSLSANLNREAEFILRGALSNAKETARLLYENSGVLQDPAVESMDNRNFEAEADALEAMADNEVINGIR